MNAGKLIDRSIGAILALASVGFFTLARLRDEGGAAIDSVDWSTEADE